MLRNSKTPVPRSLRLVNILAGLLFLTGTGLYVWAWVGMRELRSYRPPPEAGAFAAMSRFDDYWQLSRLGIWLILVAVAVAVLTAVALMIHSRRRAVPSPGESESEPPPAGT